jgi:acyl-[acyl-carrier-protein]-phospholipid O-acyltransferase/long-chain-fatty-acid--[acyl-carrier-protein] ligase
MAAGIAAGTVAALALSGDYVEFGLVPFGAAAAGFFAVGLDFTSSDAWARCWLAGLGFGVALLAVPLHGYLRDKAGNTWIANLAAAIAAAGMLCTPPDILARGAAVMLPLSVYLCWRMPESMVRFILWCTANVLFRIRIDCAENVPRTGGALLVSNHISYADAVLVGCVTRRRTIHFLMWQPIFDVPVANYFFRVLQAIPIDAVSPKATVRALRAARAKLQAGELVGIFPEGSISRTGEVLDFERGYEKILQDSEAPVIPIRIEGLWGHPLSCKGGAPFQSWQKLYRPRVTVRVGLPIRRPVTPAELRESVVRV